MELYEHQKRALANLKDGSILMGGVGSGKSQVALRYFDNCGGNSPLYIITTARKRDSADWLVEAATARIRNRPEASGVRSLVVDSWNNIAKYTDVKDAFFIFDEQRLVGSGAWAKAFLKIAKANRWILLSGTPGDVWTDYIAVFIANGFYKNRTQFKNRHLVYSYYGAYPKLERVLDEEHLERLRRSIVVEMGFERRTQRVHREVEVEYDEATFRDVVKSRQDPETGEPYQDAAGFVAGLRRIVGKDKSRLDAVRKILKTHPKVIIFYNYDYELEELRKLGSETVVAELNGHKHQDVPEGDSWVYLVQYAAGAEAWNCITTDTMIFYSLTYSYKQYEQSQGRIDRLNTPYRLLYYYSLVSDSPVDKAVQKALDSKKDFNIKTWEQSLQNL